MTAWTRIRSLLACIGVLAAGAVNPVAAGDWPQILGPERNGIAAADETLATEWPAEGPYTLWQREVGSGYAGVAVANKRTVLFHRVDGKEVTESLDAATGIIWLTLSVAKGCARSLLTSLR